MTSTVSTLEINHVHTLFWPINQSLAQNITETLGISRGQAGFIIYEHLGMHDLWAPTCLNANQ